MFVSQGLQVLLVSVLVGASFVAFGALAITPDVVESWIGERPEGFAGQGAVSQELLKISAGLAAFSGLYYAIAVLTDSADPRGVPRRADQLDTGHSASAPTTWRRG